ncbi:MAG: LPS assembly protein LptD [Desulfobulbaceae bacterium]|nr:LPS assembly protein LptD [Desulfobulbaceae bacterium]
MTARRTAGRGRRQPFLGLWIGIGLLCLLALAGRATAQEVEPWEITADRITRLKEPSIVIAEGNVILRRATGADGEEVVIMADWMRYDVALGQVKARGNLSLHSASEDVTAEAARLDLNEQTGTLAQGTLTFDHGDYTLRIAGQELRKTGVATYEIKESRVTTCPAQPGKVEPWAVQSGEVRVKKEGMAVLKPAMLMIRNTPVLYTPYLTFPAKTQRESGFLTPELSSGKRDGFGLVAPYFINIFPNVDATIYPGYLAERGVFVGGEFRYVADANSRGIFALNYLRDRKEDKIGDEFGSDSYLRTEKDRYWLRGKADHDFGDHLFGRLDLDLASDRDYLEEYRRGVSGYDSSARQFINVFKRGLQEETVYSRESSLQLSKWWPSMVAAGELQTVQDISDTPSITTPAQTLPRLLFNGRYGLDRLPLSVAWDSEYIHYWRNEGIGYQRLDLFPRIIAPAHWGILEGWASAGLHQTLYAVDVNGDAATHTWSFDRTPTRTVTPFEAHAATSLARDYSTGGGTTDNWRHLMRPSLAYQYQPAVDQQTLPDLDGTDRLDARNQLTYAWDNYLISLGGDHQLPMGRFSLRQAYSFLEERRDLATSGDQRRPFSDLLGRLEFNPAQHWSLDYETAWSVYGQGNTYYNLTTGYASGNDNRLSMQYTYQRNPEIRAPFFYSDQAAESERKLTLSLATRLSPAVSLEGSVAQRWLANDDNVDQTLKLTYAPSCWGMVFMFSNTADDQRFAFLFSLTGIGNLAGFEF